MIITILGWAGTSLILVAYILVSLKKVDGRSPRYQWMNLLGAIGVGMNVWHQQAWPALALQVTWGLIALVSLTRIVRKPN